MKTAHREEHSTKKKEERKKEREINNYISGHTISDNRLYKQDHFQIIH